MPFYRFHGTRIHYLDRGCGPPLLLLPGSTASSAVMGGEMRFFSRKYRVICPDYPGYGRSERLERFPPDFWQVNARLAAAMVRDLAGERAVLVGSSGGGMVALNAAILVPRRVRAVVADSTVRGPLDPGAIRREVENRARPTAEKAAFWRRAHGDDWERVVEADSALLLETAASGSSLYRGSPGEVRCPVLLLGSLADGMVPDMGAELCALARCMPQSRLVLYASGGHPLMWTRKREYRRDAAQFLEQLP